jgi:hypothetical protein
MKDLSFLKKEKEKKVEHVPTALKRQQAGNHVQKKRLLQITSR